MTSTLSSSQSHALRLFLLAVALAAAWIALNLAAPGLASALRAVAVVRLVIHATILTGLWLGLARTDLTSRERITVWVAVAVPFTVWLAVVWDLAVGDFFRPIPGVVRIPPPLPVAIVLPLLVGLPLLMMSRRIATLLDAIPVSWLIGLQLYRVFGGVFLAGWLQGQLPDVFGLPAGIGDVTVGVLALPVALMAARGTASGRAAAIRWNLLGLFDFAVAIATGVMTAPRPLHVLALDHPNLQTGVYPGVMVPAFAVPSSIILHALSLWQLRRAARRDAGHAAEPSLAVS